MTFGTTRAELAAALSTVAVAELDVTGHETRPSVIQVGDAWPQLASIDRGPGQTWAVSWVLFVALPSDAKRSMAATDALFYDLTDALTPYLYVEQVAPVSLETSAGERPALQITGRSE